MQRLSNLLLALQQKKLPLQHANNRLFVLQRKKLPLQQLINLLRPATEKLNCSPDQIMIGAGIQYLLGVLSGIIGTTNNGMAIEGPGYDGVRTIFQHNGFNIHPFSLDRDGIVIPKLYESKARIVYITPSHQFPYGMVIPLAKRMQLLKWAADQNGIIIEDDYDSEFRYVGKPIPSLQGLDTHHRTVYLGTFSKCLLPSLRIVYMVLPQALLEQHNKQDYRLYDQTVSRTHQETLWSYF